MKNKSQHRIPAFTVIELIIVMLLSALVIGISYMYFSQFQSYLKQNTQASTEYYTLGLFNTTIQQDFELASRINRSRSGKILILKENEELSYRFESNAIIRETEIVKDTFHFQSSALEVSEMKDYDNLVSTIKFTIKTIGSDEVSFYLYKEYNSKILFDKFNKN